MRRLKLFFNDFAKHLFVGREIGDQLAEPGVRLHPNALDLYCQGMAWFNKGFNPDDMAQTRCRAAAQRGTVIRGIK